MMFVGRQIRLETFFIGPTQVVLRTSHPIAMYYERPLTSGLNHSNIWNNLFLTYIIRRFNLSPCYEYYWYWLKAHHIAMPLKSFSLAKNVSSNLFATYIIRSAISHHHDLDIIGICQGEKLNQKASHIASFLNHSHIFNNLFPTYIIQPAVFFQRDMDIIGNFVIYVIRYIQLKRLLQILKSFSHTYIPIRTLHTYIPIRYNLFLTYITRSTVFNITLIWILLAFGHFTKVMGQCPWHFTWTIGRG